MAAAAIDHRVQQIFVGFKLGAGHIPQGGDGGEDGFEGGHPGFAFGAALVIGAAGQGTAGPGVADDQRRALWEGDQLEVQAAAVDEQGVVRLAHDADELVHDAGIDAHKMVLCPLGGQGDLGTGQLHTGGLQKGPGAADFQGCGTAQAGTPGHVAADHAFQPGQFNPPLLQGPGHAHDIVGPKELFVIDQAVQAELGPGVEFQGVEAHGAVVSLAIDQAYIVLDGHRQHKTVIIVRVFPDQVDPPRPDGEMGRLTVKMF